MKRQHLVVFIMCLCIAPCWGQTAAKSRSNHSKTHTQWTIMAYMNGRDNGLEEEVLCDFYEMLSASFSSSINLIVELSLDGKRPSHNGLTTASCPQIDNFPLDVPYWTGTRRFFIANHAAGPRFKPYRRDLGDPKALEEFVRWARNNFPAEHYMLDLWSHGEAVPRFLTKRQSADESAQGIDQQSLKSEIAKLHELNDGASISLYKNKSAHILLNSEIRNSLRRALKSTKLDVIGFDACYKGMIETAFAMNDVATVMVASEESTPPDGWDYHDWLWLLSANPRLSPSELGSLLVDSYQRSYQQKPFLTTEASMNLPKLSCLIAQIDTLAELLIQHRELWGTIAKARSGITPYQFQAVDFTAFVSGLEDELKKGDHPNQEIVNSLETIKLLLQQFVAQHYASNNSITENQSNGVAIYFPCTKERYRNDPDFRYYNPDSPDAIPFFKKHAWGRFLKAALPSAKECPHY
jgi:cysteine peptidase C11 family protein